MAGFKDFLMRGNVVDLAVGVIIGAAFGGIVDSMTKDVITPIIGAIGGQPDFSAWKVGSIGIGAFINAVSFLIKAAVVYFVIVKPFQALMNRMNPPAKPGDPPPPPPEVQLLTEIRDQLKKNASAAGAR
jgi:large conductance mechanosensitive channel